MVRVNSPKYNQIIKNKPTPAIPRAAGPNVLLIYSGPPSPTRRSKNARVPDIETTNKKNICINTDKSVRWKMMQKSDKENAHPKESRGRVRVHNWTLRHLKLITATRLFVPYASFCPLASQQREWLSSALDPPLPGF